MPEGARARAMSRRRVTLRAYVRRRWRPVGAIVVLLLGALLVLAITDRGHDPTWEARAAVGTYDQVDVSPDGNVVYALLEEGGNITRLEARAATDGALLWESRVQATRALLRAGPDGVAVATDFPLAFLTYYGADSSIRLNVPLEGNPRALEVDGDTVAIALNAPANPILVFRDGGLERVQVSASRVNTLDAHGGRLLVGTASGDVMLYAANGTSVYNLTLPASVRSARLSVDGGSFVVGGQSLAPGDLTGLAAFVDLAADEPLRWAQPFGSSIGLVDVDRAGVAVLLVEESPGRALVHLHEGNDGARRWTRTLPGTLARDDAGAFGAAALAPDGRSVALATLEGARLLSAENGEERWAFRASGGSVVVFPDDDPESLAMNARPLPSRGHETLLLFDTRSEPAIQRADVLAVGLVSLAALTLALVIGIGFHRARRSVER